jgi:hypothetical protein
MTTNNKHVTKLTTEQNRFDALIEKFLNEMTRIIFINYYILLKKLKHIYIFKYSPNSTINIFLF